MLILLIAWEIRSHREEQTSELLEAGRAFFSQIVVARKWNAVHKGVYVRVTDKTPPNPYLKTKERDIISTSGEKYTMINPAYMTRQMSELADIMGDYKFNITSLDFINPANKPDAWERSSLKAFEKGAGESFIYATDNGTGVFRYMAPLFVETPCLPCHADQGYKVGDIRGGISVSIPIRKSDIPHSSSLKITILSYVIIGFASLLFLSAITWGFSKQIIKGIEREVEHNKLRAAVELAGAAAHELRQPLTILVGHIELIQEQLGKRNVTKEDLAIIIDQCRRMDDIIVTMLNITHYKTKDYADGIRIFDLGNQPPTPPDGENI